MTPLGWARAWGWGGSAADLAVAPLIWVLEGGRSRTAGLVRAQRGRPPLRAERAASDGELSLETNGNRRRIYLMHATTPAAAVARAPSAAMQHLVHVRFRL
eukprot:COSAG03_NODE_933_length_5268_cov_25.934417_2_plen_101_part_00